MLVIGNPSRVDQYGNSLKQYNLPIEELTRKDLETKYGREINAPENFVAICDPEAGVLMAEKCLQAFQNEFKRLGGTICDGEPVADIQPGKLVTVVTNKPELIKVCYWKSKEAGAYSNQRGFPTLTIDHDKDSSMHFYGLPADEYPGLFKLCLHAGPAIDPNNRDGVSDEWVMTAIKSFVAAHFPLLHPVPAIVENCIYTWTPDANLILDTHPKHSNIVIGAGFSGHGFKLAPVVGQILNDLADNRRPAYDMTLFNMSRFKKNSAGNEAPKARL